MSDEKETCANDCCTCPRPADGKYCSAACEGAGKTTQLDCDCSHPECGSNF